MRPPLPYTKKRSRLSQLARKSADHDRCRQNNFFEGGKLHPWRGFLAWRGLDRGLLGFLGGRLALAGMVRLRVSLGVPGTGANGRSTGNGEARSGVELLEQRLFKHVAGLRRILRRNGDRHSAWAGNGGEPNLLRHHVSRFRGIAANSPARFWPTQELSIAFVTFLGAFFTIVINVIGGAQAIDVRYFQAARSMGSSTWDIFRRIILPGTLPSIVVGATVGVGITWAVVVAAEMISGGGSAGSVGGAAGGGLGFFIWNSYVGGSYTQIVAGMISIGIAGYISSAVLRKIGQWMTPWLSES
jgi:hypothetical protein